MESKLFSAFEKRGEVFDSRIAMAPMTRSRALGNIPNELMATYYAQRANAGLIITEGTSPSPNGLGYSRIPGIFNQDQVNGWKKTTDAVHKKGGKIFLQIMHTGRVGHRANLPEGAKILAPSAIVADGNMWTDTEGMQKNGSPKAMTSEELQMTIGEFVQAAKNAMAAGFDGVEIHAANGYLPNQFLNPGTNVRTDEYGGSVENRSRFVLEVSQKIAEAIGKEKTGIRFSPYSSFNDMPQNDQTFETFDYLSSELEKVGILYIHLVEAAVRQHDEGARLIAKIRENFNGILILNGGYNAELSEQAFENKNADMISFGSKFIANPDLPYRLKNGLDLNAADSSTFYTPDEKGYIDYAVFEG